MKLHTRDNVVKHMSEIFTDIPDVIIGDIFDYLVSNSLDLCKQSTDCEEDRLQNEIFKVCDDLYIKLSEISLNGGSDGSHIYSQESRLNSGDFCRQDLDLDDNMDFCKYLNLSSYFDKIKLDEFDILENYSSKSYLSVCSRNIDTTPNQRSFLNSTNLQGLQMLRRKPWNIFTIQDELIHQEMNTFSTILTRIFNSPRLFKVKESRNRKWPPEGPGSESKLIPLREPRLISCSKQNLEQIGALKAQIQDLNLSLEIQRMEYNKILSNSNNTEYRAIKSQNFKDKTLSFKMKILELQKKLFNAIFNFQNTSFIDLFSTKPKSDPFVVIDLHNFNRSEAVNLVIFSIILIIKYKFQTELEKVLSKSTSSPHITEHELEISQKTFNGSFIDIYFCVGVGNHNKSSENIDPPKLASLIRRISYALNLTWRFGSTGFIVVRLQENPSWYRFIQQFLE
ncbi:hypothetical protein OJ253_446 [Cryptosporidium canis]|uniref:Uncharacterized protein n=1 Tax=Cryptosporidium canis TaxID=195482 RepID=A0A9D5DIR1_9CRYT|nr:hypothetical protein OJ253_446 [Cryptosporidium canis]